MDATELNVKGMTCNHCKMAVEKTVGSIIIFNYILFFY